jgi:hypothetical protein
LAFDASGSPSHTGIWAIVKPGIEDVFLATEADTAAYSGQLGNARELSRRAVASAQHAQEKETAANYESSAALREALSGNPDEARQRAAAALELSTGRDVQYKSALALALTGDAARAQALADDLNKRYPDDTIVQFAELPILHAQPPWAATTLRKPSTCSRRLRLTSWELPLACIPFMCAARRIWRRMTAARPQASSRKLSTIACWC